MVRDFLNKVYGNSVVLMNLRGQRHIPYLSEDELRARRDARLRKIVRYAVETVPYYRNLFRTEGIDPREIRSADDLARLPLIDKKTVRKDPNLFLSTSRRGKQSIPVITSGSTGTPLEVHHDRVSLLANIAFGEREREVISRVSGISHGYREVNISYRGSTGEVVRSFYRQWTFIPIRPKRLSLSVLEPVEHIVERINHFRPEIIVGFGSYLETLFRMLASRKMRMHLPRLVIYSAESMTREGRALIEERFGVPVLTMYNAVEAFKIGFFCEERKNFHLHDDLCHVRIVDANGHQVACGAKGEVVISNLVNRGTVLFNYRLGDVASMPSERCACGRTFPLLSELEGRVEDIVLLPDGGFVHPRAVWGVLKQRNEVLRYQMIQHDLNRFELKLVTVDRPSYERVIGRILGDLRGLLGKPAIIEAAYYEELQPEARGKFRPVVSLCKQKGFD